MKITVETQLRAVMFGPIPFLLLTTISELTGKRAWRGTDVVFEPNQTNKSLIEKCGFQFEVEGSCAEYFKLEDPHKIDQDSFEKAFSNFKFNRPFWKHQKACIKKSWLKKGFAIFAEPGLGKTGIMLFEAGMLYQQGHITGLLILSPKDIHVQTVTVQLTANMDKTIKANVNIWKKKKFSNDDLIAKGKLTILSMNIDSVKTQVGLDTIRNFFEVHGEKTMWAIDESQAISNHSADRTKIILKLSEQAGYRRIYTGTPIAKHVGNLWPQFMFLDPSILQQTNYFAFRSRYCMMGGFGGKQIVGSKNIEHLNSLILPYSFRITKKEALDLPEKIYIKHRYEMDAATREHYESVKRMLMTTLSDGTHYDVNGTAVGLLRCQQVVCGTLPFPEQDAEAKDDWKYDIISDQRIKELIDVIEKFDEEAQIVIWSRFINDIKRIVATLNKEYGADSCVEYHGGRNSKQREEAKALFQTDKRRFFVGNQATSAGLDGLQDNCHTVIYFSNTHSMIHRVQSEDRNHRGGTKFPVTYVDMIAIGSCDAGIMSTLRANRSLSDLTLDEIRMALQQDET